MGAQKKIDLSNAGQLLLDMLRLVDTLVPDIVRDIDPDYDSKSPGSQKEIDKRAQKIVTTVLSGLMKP